MEEEMPAAGAGAAEGTDAGSGKKKAHKKKDKKDKKKSAMPEKKFEVKSWKAVATWTWDICTDTCAICRNPLYEPSIEYQAMPSRDNIAGLSIAWGACGHVFHLDCIQRWQKTRQSCPLCNREWEFARIESIGGEHEQDDGAKSGLVG
jgi:RING-box protein 1